MKNEPKLMHKVQFSTRINATKEKVWKTMLNDETYREWTSVFAEGSYYKGNWDKGSKILFLGPNGDGMLSRIADSRPHEFVSIEHLGCIKDGIEDVESDEAKAFAGAHENYTLKDKNGETEVLVEVDLSDEYADMFNNMWPKALAKLKEIAEK